MWFIEFENFSRLLVFVVRVRSCMCGYYVPTEIIQDQGFLRVLDSCILGGVFQPNRVFLFPRSFLSSSSSFFEISPRYINSIPFRMVGELGRLSEGGPAIGDLFPFTSHLTTYSQRSFPPFSSWIGR